jgi:hypothetical protein
VRATAWVAVLNRALARRVAGPGLRYRPTLGSSPVEDAAVKLQREAGRRFCDPQEAIWRLQLGMLAVSGHDHRANRRNGGQRARC